MNQSNPTEYICKNCNKLKSEHRKDTLQCPITSVSLLYKWSNATIYYPKQYKEGVEVEE